MSKSSVVVSELPRQQIAATMKARLDEEIHLKDRKRNQFKATFLKVLPELDSQNSCYGNHSKQHKRSKCNLDEIRIRLFMACHRRPVSLDRSKNKLLIFSSRENFYNSSAHQVSAFSFSRKGVDQRKQQIALSKKEKKIFFVDENSIRIVFPAKTLWTKKEVGDR